MTELALRFTDGVDSRLLGERLGDERAAQVRAERDRRARRLPAEHHGREIDRSDGLFLLFDAAADGTRFDQRQGHPRALRELLAGGHQVHGRLGHADDGTCRAVPCLIAPKEKQRNIA